MSAVVDLAPGQPLEVIPPAPPPAPARTRELPWLVAALAVGTAIRIAIGMTDGSATTDETAYIRSGTSLVSGHGFNLVGRPELHFPPGLPFALGLAGKVVDPHTGAVILTCVSSSLLVLVLARLGRRLGGPRAGILTAWVAALAPALSTTLVNRGAGSEAEYMLLVVTALWLVASSADHRGGARLAWLVAAGTAVGLAYLTRPEALFVAVPLGLAILFGGVGRTRPRRREAGGRRALVRHLVATLPRLALFALPIVVCVAPYAAYLHSHTGKWELSAKTQDVSIQGWLYGSKGDRGAKDSLLWRLDDAGNLVTPRRTSLTALARSDPKGYAHIVAANAGVFEDEIVTPEAGKFLSWLLLPLPVWAVAVAGAWRYRRSRLAWLVLSVAALPVITGLAYFTQPRYLLMLVALATIFVGAALADVRARWRPWAVGAVLALLALSTVQGFTSAAAGWWHPTDGTDMKAAGEWIKAHSGPDDRLMSRSMIAEYYAGREAMAIPYADEADIVAFGRRYGARYLVLDWYTATHLRPQLAFLRHTTEAPGLRLVHKSRVEGHTTRIFEFDPRPTGTHPKGPPLSFAGDSKDS